MMKKSKIVVLSKDSTLVDEISNAVLGGSMLQEVVARDLDAGFEYLKTIHSAIVLLDEDLCHAHVGETVAKFAQAFPQNHVVFMASPGKQHAIRLAQAGGGAAHLLKPLDAGEVVRVLGRLLANSPRTMVDDSKQPENCARQGKVVTVFGTMGGIGKTTIAVNLAAALGQMPNRTVCLVDADLQFGDVCRALHVAPQSTIADFAANKELNTCLTRWRNVDVLAAPLHLEQALVVTADMLNAALASLRQYYDYIVVDTAVDFSEEFTAVLDVTDVLLFVGALDYIPSVKNIRVGLELLKHVGYHEDNVKLILNRYRSKNSINIKEAEALLGRRFMAMLPNDFPTTVTALQKGVPFIIDQPGKRLSRELLRLAETVHDGTWGEQLFITKLALKWKTVKPPKEKPSCVHGC